MSSSSNPSSMQPQNGSANDSYNGSPAPTSYISAASHASHSRYNTGDPQTIITSISNLSVGEASQVDYQWDNSSLIPAMFDYRPIEVTQSNYPRYLVIDGDSTPGQYSSYAAPNDTSAYDYGYNHAQTVYDTLESTDQTTAQMPSETTSPPSPTTVRWASEYESHEARALGLGPPPNKCANQQKKDGIAPGHKLSSDVSVKSSRSRKKSKSTN